MNYIVYDITGNSPSPKERDIIWSALLFADKMQITSNFSYFIFLLGHFSFLPEDVKLGIYTTLGPKIYKEIDWRFAEEYKRTISRIRRTKHKTGNDMKIMSTIKVSMSQFETSFIQILKNILNECNYEEIAPLILQYENEKAPDINLKVAVDRMEKGFEDLDEHFIKIITNALAQTDSIFVFDERILPFTKNYPIDKLKIHDAKGEKAPVFSEKIFTMPLCYVLKKDEIKSARNEMKPFFQDFHECIHRISAGEEELKSGMEKLRSMLPDIQNKIESNTFVHKARNQSPDIQSVDMHVAFTSNRGILIILKHLGMLNEEQVLQASDIVIKESNLDKLRPFMFITHPKQTKNN